MLQARKVSPFEESLAAVSCSQRCDSCVMVTKHIVQPFTGAPSYGVGIDVEKRCAGSTKPQAQFVHAGRMIFADCKMCPCSWSIEDDPSPETTHSSIDRRCPPFLYGVFLEYHLQYLGWESLVYNK